MINSFGEFIQRIMESGLEAIGLYYGVYRASIIDNADPKNQGRLMLHCEQVHGSSWPEVWSWPETPYAGNGFGFWAIPDIGEYVYVRFDHGRPDKPIWHGGWWGDQDMTDDMVPGKVVLATAEGLKIVIDRTAGSILLEQSPGNSVLIDPTQIYLTSDGDIKCEGKNVTVQSMGAVEVSAQGTCYVEAFDEIRVTSLGLIKIDAADNIDITCSAFVSIYSANTLTLQSDTLVDIVSLTAINVSAPTLNFTGEFNLLGNGTVDGTFLSTQNSAHHVHPLDIPNNTALEGPV